MSSNVGTYNLEAVGSIAPFAASSVVKFRVNITDNCPTTVISPAQIPDM